MVYSRETATTHYLIFVGVLLSAVCRSKPIAHRGMLDGKPVSRRTVLTSNARILKFHHACKRASRPFRRDEKPSRT